jgi:NAD(P)-dependent dehydrogenase (short-subunit alcohol dehydrogenase family)
MLHRSGHMPLHGPARAEPHPPSVGSAFRRTYPPQVVMITGASAGVGRAVARAFGHRGALLGLFARGRAGLEAAARDVAAAGGYDAQQTSEPEDLQRLHNLWSPVDDSRDFGAHGRFDTSARSSSLELVISKHHRAFAALGVALAAATLVYFRRAA